MTIVLLKDENDKFSSLSSRYLCLLAIFIIIGEMIFGPVDSLHF